MRKKLTGPLLILIAAVAFAEDREYVQALERVQRTRPAVIGSAGRIAPEGEPGTPLVIHGRVFRADGRTPAPDVVVFAYHTDNAGLYNREHAAHVWRLHGWVKSDRDGRFEIRTIRPAPYPGGRVPAHVHVILDDPGVPHGSAGGLMFLDDPILSDQEKRDSAAKGAFGSVRPVVTRGGAQHVELNLRISETGRL